MFVTLVGCTISRSPMMLSGRAPRRLNVEQHQRLVAREGQLVRAQQRVELAEEDLLGPHDRGDRGYRRRGTEPEGPDLRRQFDRVERQLQRLTHGVNPTSAARRAARRRPEGVQACRPRPGGQLVEPLAGSRPRSAARASAAISSRARARRRRSPRLGPSQAPCASRADQVVDALAPPAARRRRSAASSRLAALRQGDHAAQVADRLLGAGLVALVHHEHVGDLQDARLGRLDRVTQARRDDDQGGVGQPAISTSAWPTPTVSIRITSKPAASSTRSACGVAPDRPPR